MKEISDKMLICETDEFGDSTSFAISERLGRGTEVSDWEFVCFMHGYWDELSHDRISELTSLFTTPPWLYEVLAVMGDERQSREQYDPEEHVLFKAQLAQAMAEEKVKNDAIDNRTDSDPPLSLRKHIVLALRQVQSLANGVTNASRQILHSHKFTTPTLTAQHASSRGYLKWHHFPDGMAPLFKEAAWAFEIIEHASGARIAIRLPEAAHDLVTDCRLLVTIHRVNVVGKHKSPIRIPRILPGTQSSTLIHDYEPSEVWNVKLRLQEDE